MAEKVRLRRRVAGENGFAGVEVSNKGDVLIDLGIGRNLFIEGVAYDPTPVDPSSFKLLDTSYVPQYPATFTLGSSNVHNVPTADAGYSGLDEYLKCHIDGVGQYVSGQRIYLETSGTPTDAILTGIDVHLSNYGTTGIDTIYGVAATVNAEWKADYIYGGFFSAAPGSVNADNSAFIAGVSSYAGFGHHANTDRTVGYEAVLYSAPSGSPVVADKLIGLNVWGVANDKCTADKVYGVYLESFTKGGSGAFNHIYGFHADSTTFDNTVDGWFLHNESDAPSLLSGPLQFAILPADPPSPPAGRFSIYGLESGGKVKVMVKFPTGASQQLAIEV